MTRTRLGIPVAGLALALLSPACGPGASASPDGSTSDAASDAAGDASNSEAGACVDLSGAYELTGTCSVPGFSPFPAASIVQTGCDATISVLTGTIAGTVRGNQVSFTTALGPITLECTATQQVGGLGVHCEAMGGGATCDADGAAADFPGATRYGCDVHAQDCGAGLRCNVVSITTTNNTLTTACVPAGSAADGASCTRRSGRIGDEACGAGLFCSNVGQTSAVTRVCQRLCRLGSECAAGEVCTLLSTTPRAGSCTRACTIGGTDCSAGTTCRPRQKVGTTESEAPSLATACEPAGALAAGAACIINGDCGANLTCVRRDASDPFTCRATCDTAHPCASGQTCTPLDGVTNPTGGGFCVPSAG